MSRVIHKATITIDDSDPTVYHLDRDADIVLVQMTLNHYEVRKGRWHIGDLTFYDGGDEWGWQFMTRSLQFRSCHRLGPYPESVLPRRLRIDRVTHDQMA